VALAELRELLAVGGVDLPPECRFTPLTGGTFNTVHRVTAPGSPDLVLKVAPPKGTPTLAYERSLLATEALFDRAAAGTAPVPQVCAVPDAAAWLLVSACPGVPWHGLDLVPGVRARLRHRLGEVAAALHGVTGPGFGYPQWGLEPDWVAAFTGMVEALLDDAGRFRVALPRPAAELRRLLSRTQRALAQVTEPVLVHFDLWPGNVLVDAEAAEITGIVDGERAFWGDPLAETASLTLFGTLDTALDLVAGYRTGGGRLGTDAAARCRIAWYRAYLYLIMTVETVPRGSADLLPRATRHLERALHELDTHARH
jgi:aminoglycoside phosphotransferase (APT) family kinase protein